MTKEEKHQIKLARRRHNRFLRGVEKKLAQETKLTRIVQIGKNKKTKNSRKVTLKDASKIIGIECNCLLYFFRKRFYNLENISCKISFDYLDKLLKYKNDKSISSFFIEKGYKLIIEEGILSTLPKIKQFNNPTARITTNAIETKRSKH